MINNSNKEIAFPDLSYKIVGAAFEVFNKSEWGLPERYYQEALAKELELSRIFFKREVFIPLEYKSHRVGRLFADFLVEDKILLELKVVSKLGYTHAKQLLGYLQGMNLQLGILLYFTRDGVKYRRVVNPGAVRVDRIN